MARLPPFVVAVDVDEVLAQYLKGYSAYHNSVHGADLKVSDFHTYKFWEVHGGTQEECVRQVYAFHETAYFRDLEVVPGAHAGVADLASLPGVVLHVVTSRHAEVAEATRRWLGLHFPGAFGDRIHIGNHWGSSQAARVSKADMCANVGAKVLIDDSTIYCKEAAEAGVHAVLFDLHGGYGWSQDLIEGPRVVRAHNWPEVVTRVRRLLHELHGGHWVTPLTRKYEVPCLGPGPPDDSPGAVAAVRFPPGTKEELKPGRDCVACAACVVA